VLIAAIGIDVNTQNTPCYAYNVSSITEKGVTWTRVVNESYIGWEEDVDIWFGVVSQNADPSLTFSFYTNPPTPMCFLVEYDVCEFSGLATVSPVDQTAVYLNEASLPQSDTGRTAVTTKPNELWIGAVLTYSSVPQSEPTNNFLMIGGQPNATGGRMSTALLARIVNQTGIAESGTHTFYNGQPDLTTSMGCIATFFAQNQNPTNNVWPLSTASPAPLSSSLIKLACQSTTSTNIRVSIEGNLTVNGIGIPDVPVLLSYSINNGTSWTELTTVNTDNSGDFTVLWTPLATGNYLLEAAWSGNYFYPPTNTTVNLVITPCQAQSFFSITTNSTLSGLSFDSATKQLSFTVSGPPGTTGYLDIYIPKSLISDISALTVSFDGNSIPYSSQSVGDSWLVSFTYHHSTHHIVMMMNGAPATQFFGNSLVVWLVVVAILGPFAIAVAFLAARILRNRKRS
jgi:hypothetical protein